MDISTSNFVWAGIDISAKKLDVAVLRDGIEEAVVTFGNDAKGHKSLIRALTHGKRRARVVMEATGTYGFELALALEATPRVEVMIAEPKKVKDYGVGLGQRSKTDRADAKVILKYGTSNHLEWVPWVRPSDTSLKLRSITRRIDQITAQVVEEKARVHAKGFEGSIGHYVLADLKKAIAHLEGRIKKLRGEALRAIEGEPLLKRRFELLVSVKGIGEASAITILGELCILPENMKAPQWVAYAGLDPQEHQSGTSVKRRGRISRKGNAYLRKALYMPSVAALRYNPNVKAFYKKLVERGGKPKMVALIAVMRKLLHAIWGMFAHDALYDGQRLFPIPVNP